MNNEEKIIELLTEIRDSLKKPEPKKRGKVFVPPTAVEVASYCGENSFKTDAQSFIDFYESKGWMIGKNKMKDWKAAVRTWEKKVKETKTANNNGIGAQKNYPPGFDPSRSCGAGESFEACKIRAWREYERRTL